MIRLNYRSLAALTRACVRRPRRCLITSCDQPAVPAGLVCARHR